MRIRLIGGVAALAIALGALAFPSVGPVEAGSRCTGWTSSINPPTSIRVYRTATRRTQRVPFRPYVETVMASEWGAGAPAAALRAGAIAVKQFGWYYASHWRGGRDAAGRCYDVVDTSRDQVYNPSRRPAASIRAAVAATWSVSLRKGARFFLTGYRSGTGSCTTHVDGWRLYQRDAVNCVARYRDSTETLLRRFYSSVSVVTPGANDFSGDGRGDAAAAVTDPVTGDLTARVYTADSLYTAAVGATGLTTLGNTSGETVVDRASTDVDGDGRQDLVQLVTTADGVAELQVLRGSRDGFDPAVTWWSSANDPAALLPGTLHLVTGDFDGDGRGDAGLVRTPPADVPQTATLWVATSRGTSFAPVRRRWSAAGDFTAARFLAGDFSGDGRADLAILAATDAGTTSSVAVTSPTLSMRAARTWGTEPVPPSSITAVVGDANRDGRDDLILVRPSPGGIRVIVARSTGSRFARTPFGDTIAIPFDGTRFASADVNRDGRADLLAFVSRGIDEAGISLGTDIWRLHSTGAAYRGSRWLTDPTLDPATTTVH